MLGKNTETNYAETNYACRLEACKQVYTPRGVEQVMNAAGLPGVMICQVQRQGTALYKTCMLCYYIKWNFHVPV